MVVLKGNKMKVILHLCADIGSDSKIWSDNGYEVIRVGKDIGVENFNYSGEVYGIISNPVCLEFSTARSNGKARNPEDGMLLVRHCQRVIRECNPDWWYIENPARGVLKNYLGKPDYKYEPWWFGSPWSKETALWGNFNIPKRLYDNWQDVPKNNKLYIRPTREKPSLAFMHKSAIDKIEEFTCFKDKVSDDMSFRSLCSQKFAQAFFEANQ